MGLPQGLSGSIHPSGNDNGESIETRSGLAAIVSARSSSSVLKLLVVAIAPVISAQPVARLALPVKSIPTTVGVRLVTEHFSTKCVTRLLLLLDGSRMFEGRLVRGNGPTPRNTGLAVFKNSAVCRESRS